MDLQSIIHLLQQVEIFKTLPSAILSLLAQSAGQLNFSSGEVIINKGEEGNSMFVIAEGSVKIHDGEHVVAQMEKNNFFGEFTLLDSAPRSMSVTALTGITLLCITREMFFNILKNQPDVSQKIISALTSRLRGQNESIINQLKQRESELIRLVDERTSELRLSNEEISVKNREITENLTYARHIQAAILPDEQNIKKNFPDSFVLYLPKDIVSGDFYSFYSNEQYTTFIAADCTGHGVTGAFISVMGSSLLNQIINERKILDPGKILDQLHLEIISTLNQRHNESNDGIDLAICRINKEKTKILFAGANRPLWLIRNGEIIDFPPNKFPVGGLQIDHHNNFTSHEIPLEKNDAVYIFSDGFADQFGGEKGRKLMTKKFREILLSIQHLHIHEQKIFLKDFFETWKGKQEQVDDVLVIGINI